MITSIIYPNNVTSPCPVITQSLSLVSLNLTQVQHVEASQSRLFTESNQKLWSTSCARILVRALRGRIPELIADMELPNENVNFRHVDVHLVVLWSPLYIELLVDSINILAYLSVAMDALFFFLFKFSSNCIFGLTEICEVRLLIKRILFCSGLFALLFEVFGFWHKCNKIFMNFSNLTWYLPREKLWFINFCAVYRKAGQWNGELVVLVRKWKTLLSLFEE